MSLKIPFFVVFCMAYYTISPWAAPLAEWVCGQDFQQMRSALGGDYATCVQWFPWFWTLNNLPYLFVYGYSLKASYEWFRCHPSNDHEGIWCSRAAPACQADDYTNLDHGTPI